MNSIKIQTKLSDCTTPNRWTCSSQGDKYSRGNKKEASNSPKFSNKQEEESATNLGERRTYSFSGMELVLNNERPLCGYTLNDHIETGLIKEDNEWWQDNEEDSIEICRHRRSRRASRRRLVAVVDSLRWDSDDDDEEDSIKVYNRRHARKTRTVVAAHAFCSAE